MRIKAIRNLILIYSVLSLCFCKGQTSNKPWAEGQDNIKDTVIKDIPPDKLEQSYQQIKSNIERKLNLGKLEEGFDGLQIRLWYGYAFKDKEQLIILKERNSSWSAELHTITFQFSDKYDSVLSITKETIDKNPKSGWKNFMAQLIGLDILTLPDYQKIPNYNLSTDPDGITIEIATAGSYRIYTYPEPSYYKKHFLEAEKIVKIMDLIEDEFSFKRLRIF